MAKAESTTLTFRIEPALKDALRAAAEKEHRSIATMVAVMIRDYCGRVWAAADQFRAYSGLKRQEYSGSALGLHFLRFAERVRRRRPHGYELYPECVFP